MKIATLAVALLCASCAGVTTLSSPKVLDEGQDQYLLAPELNGGGARNAPIPVPEMSFGYRRGIGHGYELDAKVSTLPLGEAMTTLGMETAGKKALYQSERWTITAAAGVGYRQIHSSGASWEGVYVNAPLLVGLHIGDDMLIIGPRVGFQRWYSSGAMPVDIPFAGTSVGYAWAATDNLTVFPELSLMRSPTTFQDRPDGSSMVTLGVGFLFGHGGR